MISPWTRNEVSGQDRRVKSTAFDLCRRRTLPALLFGLCSLLSFLQPISGLAASPPPDIRSLVDLHAHYFFHDGMGLALLGSFHDPLKALTEGLTWRSRLTNKVNAETLEKSGVGLALVALYAHPLFLLSERNSIRKQIEEAQGFVREHPDWIIARDPQSARQARAAGKRILILSLEGMAGVLENEDDFREFIDQDGIRVVTPIHFIDDEIGGANLMPAPWLMLASNPAAALRAYASPHFDAIGVRTNPRGLTPFGRTQIEALIKRGVWIDFAHASDASQEQMLSLTDVAQQPLLYTHTVLRSAYRSERAISATQLTQIARRHGVIGLLPSDDMLKGTEVDPAYCDDPCRAAGEKCQGGLPAFLTQYAQAQRAVAPAQVMIGSDIDAPLTFLGPACPAEKLQDPRGLADYGQLSVIGQALKNHSRETGDPVDWFLTAWERVKSP